MFAVRDTVFVLYTASFVSRVTLTNLFDTEQWTKAWVFSRCLARVDFSIRHMVEIPLPARKNPM